MIAIPNNGRTLRKGDELRDRLLADIADYKAHGVRYPSRTVDNLYAVPFVWLGRVPYHAATLERLQLTRDAKKRPVTLPDHFVLDGEQRLLGESREQYRKYRLYRDLGPERSFGKVARLLGGRVYGTPNNIKVVGVSHLSAMAARWRWAERVAAFDAQTEIEARRAQVKIQEDQMREHIERRQTYLDSEYAVVERGVTRIKQMLSFPVDQQRIVTKRDAEGREVAVTIIEPAKWTYASLARIEAEVTKLARLHFGMSEPNASAKIETIPGSTDRADRPMSIKEREAHEYASHAAENAYFVALEEYHQKEVGREC